MQRRMEWEERWVECYGATSKVISYGARNQSMAKDVFIVIPGDGRK